MKRSDVRKVDQIAIEQYGMSGLVLMENAGRGAAEHIAGWLRHHPRNGKSVVRILCGTGNNGGDGYVIARHLDLMGYTVSVVSLVPLEKLTGDASANASIAQKSGIRIDIAEASGLKDLLPEDVTLVDCMLGTGAMGEPRGIYGDAIGRANPTQGARIAIDLPTGLDCDTGIPSSKTFRADLTITFVATKDGFSADTARPVIGDVHVVGIGAPKRLLEEFGIDPTS